MPRNVGTVISKIETDYEFNPTGQPGGERYNVRVTPANGTHEYNVTLSAREYARVVADIAAHGTATLPAGS